MQHERIEGAWVVRALLALTGLMLLAEAFSLYVFPLPDSARYWFGDESWLMLEARTQIVEGVLRHPYAYGATLYHYVGVLGNTWVTSLIYGLPAALLDGRLPIILIGRSVTFLIGLVTVISFYRVTRRTTKSPLIASFGTLLLVTSTTFVLAVHTARTDLIVGAVVFLVVAYIAQTVEQPFTKPSEWFLFGASMTLLGLTIALHLITLLLPLCIYILYRKGAFKQARLLLSALGGVLVSAGVLILIYYLTTGDFSLYGSHGQHVQFMDVTFQKPILRPFSRSVQWNNLVQRIQLLWDGAPFFVALFVVALARVGVDKLRGRRGLTLTPQIRFSFMAAVIVCVSWLLFQTSLEYYVPHFFFLGSYVTLLFFHHAWHSSTAEPRNAQPAQQVGVAFLAIGLIAATSQLKTLKQGYETGQIIRAENRRAGAKLILDIMRERRNDARDARPLVLAESPCAIDIARSTNFRIMAPFFFAFPERAETPEATLRRYHVDYALLYSTPLAYDPTESHHKLEQAIAHEGVLIDTAVGVLFDKGRTYEDPQFAVKDTFKLYRMNFGGAKP